MQEWEQRQRHHDEVVQILRDNGALDQRGRLRRWNGPVLVPALERAGHSSLAFDKCGCRGERVDVEGSR